ncbi:MAG TPA: hypothetical protein VLI90_05925, partial [Tepidisphaeraceae bacterium]|nr:hypothetical protein [Tepidisphaeraceae bacterium]
KFGSDIIEYNPTNNAIHNGTNVHTPLVTHSISGLATNGVGIVNGTDGYIYSVGSAGLQRIDPSNWAAPAVTLPGSVGGQGYGVNTLPNGKIVYSDGSNSSSVWVYDPVALTNTLIYSASFLVDDIETGPAGEIALAGQSNSSITILNSGGGLIKQFNTARFPDGLAFGAGPFANSIYANNNDGSITRYDMSAGWTGTVTPVDIATTLAGHHGYGDLASVGPDCAFYISTFPNVNFGHGNDAGIGTNWDNGVTNGEASIVRVGSSGIGADGLPNSDCVFYSLIETTIPEPGSAMILAIGMLPMLCRRRSHRMRL